MTSNPLLQNLISGLVVFLVALPLCLGIALASDAPLMSGLIAGIVGGIVVGSLSGSATSVSGPAAGLTVVVATQIESLGSFEAFLLAIVVGGILQVVLGILRLGVIAIFCPSSVIQGLLAAIGLILILKQTPHLVGHDSDPEGEMAFQQPDKENTLSEILEIASDLHIGAAVVGLVSLVLLFAWDRWKLFQRTGVPAPLIVVIVGGIFQWASRHLGERWFITNSHLVQVPVASNLSEFNSFITFPDFALLGTPAIYLAGVTIALVASLETLLNLEAVDNLDPQRRRSPPNRELLAQGTGNIVSGLLGGLPLTAVIIRGTVNINSGATNKLSAIAHGVFLLTSILLMPTWLNIIPISCLAAILFQTGLKLASWSLVSKMWSRGLHQFVPFVATVGFILFTDLLIGVVAGLVFAFIFILHGNLVRPIHQVREKHVSGDVLRIELADQVSFLNKASLREALDNAYQYPHVLIDARRTEYIDSDVLDLIKEYHSQIAPTHGSRVSMIGFRDRYSIENHIDFIDYTSRDLQQSSRPQDVLDILQQGNERFRLGHRLTRDIARLKQLTADGQFPLAVILSCIDSRTPVELIFDLALGDVFSVRIAGNVAKEKALGSMEYSCVVAGAKLVVVLGHTRCGAVTSAVDLFYAGRSALESTGCDHLDVLVTEIQKSIAPQRSIDVHSLTKEAKEEFVDTVARHNVMRTLEYVRTESHALRRLEEAGEIAIVGGLYNLQTGRVDFFGGLSPIASPDRMKSPS